MDKKFITLTEEDLHNIVKESVSKILNEGLYAEKIESFQRLAVKSLQSIAHHAGLYANARNGSVEVWDNDNPSTRMMIQFISH